MIMGKRTHKTTVAETSHSHSVNPSSALPSGPGSLTVSHDESSNRSVSASVPATSSIPQPPAPAALKQPKSSDEGPVGYAVGLPAGGSGMALGDQQAQSQYAGSSLDVSTDELEFHEAAGGFEEDDYDMSGSEEPVEEQRRPSHQSSSHHSKADESESNNHGRMTSTSTSATAKPAKAATSGKERSLKSSVWNGGPGVVKSRNDTSTGQSPPPPKSGSGSRGQSKKSSDIVQSLENKVASLEAALSVSRENSHSLQDDLNAYKAEVKVLQKEKKALQEKATLERTKNEEHAHSLYVLKSDLRLALDNAADARAKAESDLKRMEAHWKSEWETRHTHLVSKLSQQREATEMVKRELEVSESEVFELRTQNSKLKHSISTSTRMEAQTTDDTFSELTRSLGHGISNWALNFVRGTKLPKIDPSKITETDDKSISAIIPAWKSIVGARKAGVIQGLVSGVLVEDVLTSYFFGLPEEKVQAVREMEGYLSQISTPVDMNLWRSTTLSLLRRSQDPALHSALSAASSTVHSRVVSLISSLTSIPTTHPHFSLLTPLIDQTVSLSRLLRIQRAVFTVLLPKGQVFDGKEMDDVSGAEEDALEGRNVSLVVFPGLCKFGDEMGDRLEWRNLIVRSKVVCADD